MSKYQLNCFRTVAKLLLFLIMVLLLYIPSNAAELERKVTDSSMFVQEYSSWGIAKDSIKWGSISNEAPTIAENITEFKAPKVELDIGAEEKETFTDSGISLSKVPKILLTIVCLSILSVLSVDALVTICALRARGRTDEHTESSIEDLKAEEPDLTTVKRKPTRWLLISKHNEED